MEPSAENRKNICDLSECEDPASQENSAEESIQDQKRNAERNRWCEQAEKIAETDSQK